MSELKGAAIAQGTIKGTVATEGTIKGILNATGGQSGKSAYEIAIKNGFEGTEKEWLESLKGASGVYLGSGDMPDDYNVQIDPDGEILTIERIIEMIVAQTKKITSVTLYADQWKGETSPYSQLISVSEATKNSKIDLNPTVEQLSIFHNKDITFVVENDNAVITVYCIGQKPANDYIMQATITEVNANG